MSVIRKATKDSDQNINDRVFQTEEVEELRSAYNRLEKRVAVMEKNEQRLAALNAISSLITQSLEIHDVLALAADKIMEVMDAEAIVVFLLDEETNELVLELYRGGSKNLVTGETRITVGEGPSGVVAATGDPMIATGNEIDMLSSGQSVVTRETKSQLIVPLKSKGRVIGTLCMARRRPTKFHTDEVELLSSIGNQIGANLENVRLYQDMKEALRQLQQSEERYRHLFENASDAIWVHDLEGNTIAVNKACEDVTGYSSQELMNLRLCELMFQDRKSCIGEVEEKLLANEPFDHSCEVEFLRKGGDKAIVEVTTSLIYHYGEVAGFQHAARDVTDERQMQDNLHYYLQLVTKAQEDERKRVARELHDETLQNLIVISRQLDKITSSDALWEVSSDVVRSLKKQIEVAVQEMRRFSHDLRPSVLDDLGLLPALELLTDDLEKEGISTRFQVIGKARRLAPEVEVMLFRIAQEAVRNMRRHSRASTAELVIEFTDGNLRVVIKDNGIGFTLPQRPGDLASLGKLGLVGMYERARLLGGTLMLQSEPNTGTTIVVEVRV